MNSRNHSARAVARPAACLVAALMLPAGAAAQEGKHESVTGIVEQVQMIDASSLGGGRALIVRLEDGAAFRLPYTDHVAAGPGVKARIRYRATGGDDALPVACSATVLALPLDPESGDSLKPANRPFEIYRNPDCG